MRVRFNTAAPPWLPAHSRKFPAVGLGRGFRSRFLTFASNIELKTQGVSVQAATLVWAAGRGRGEAAGPRAAAQPVLLLPSLGDHGARLPTLPVYDRAEKLRDVPRLECRVGSGEERADSGAPVGVRLQSRSRVQRHFPVGRLVQRTKHSGEEPRTSALHTSPQRNRSYPCAKILELL